MLAGVPMHPMSYQQKRAHLCAVARGREMFAGVEDRMIEFEKDIARALGDTSEVIYTLDYEPDH
jgi:hypothetical protein